MRHLYSLLVLAAAPLAAAAQEKDISLPELLAWMSDGKRTFVYDQRTEAEFRNSAIRLVPEDGDKVRGYARGVSLLRAAGLAVIALDEPAGGIVRIVPVQRAAFETPRVCESEQALPEADEFCSLAVPFRHLNAGAALALAQRVCGDPQRATLDAEGRRVLLTGYASDLRRAAGLLRSSDVEPATAAWRIRVAVLAAAPEGDADLPEEFRGLGLEEATGLRAFRRAGDAICTLQTGASAANPRPDLRGALRFDGRPGFHVEFEAAADPGGLTLERFLVRAEASAPNQSGQTLLIGRPRLRDGVWTLAGSIPGEAPGTMRIVMVRADKVK